MTQYLLSVHVDYAEAAATPEAEMHATYQAVEAFNQELRDSGAWVFAGGLHPADTATVVTPKDGSTIVTDGPFAETKEQLGGFWVVEAPDLDAALELAKKAAIACAGPVEVRAFEDEPTE